MTLNIQVPTKMNGEQKELLRAFDKAMYGEKEPKAEKSSTKEKKKPFKRKK